MSVAMPKSKQSPASTTASEPLLVTTKVAAGLLSVSTWEIRRLCRKGQLAFKRLSKTNWLVNFQSLKAYAEGRAA
jgi:hypothetical protein